MDELTNALDMFGKVDSSKQKQHWYNEAQKFDTQLEALGVSVNTPLEKADQLDIMKTNLTMQFIALQAGMGTIPKAEIDKVFGGDGLKQFKTMGDFGTALGQLAKQVDPLLVEKYNKGVNATNRFYATADWMAKEYWTNNPILYRSPEDVNNRITAEISDNFEGINQIPQEILDEVKRFGKDIPFDDPRRVELSTNLFDRYTKSLNDGFGIWMNNFYGPNATEEIKGATMDMFGIRHSSGVNFLPYQNKEFSPIVIQPQLGFRSSGDVQQGPDGDRFGPSGRSLFGGKDSYSRSIIEHFKSDKTKGEPGVPSF